MSQLRALCDGHREVDALEEARSIAAVRLAVWGEARDVQAHIRRLTGDAKRGSNAPEIDHAAFAAFGMSVPDHLWEPIE